MSDEPQAFDLSFGSVFNINGKYRCVLLGKRLYYNGDVTYMEFYAGPADGINGPEEKTLFTVWLGTVVHVQTRFVEPPVAMTVTSIDVHEQRSPTPDDPERSVSASVTIRLYDVLEAQRIRDYERAQRELVLAQAKLLREGDQC